MFCSLTLAACLLGCPQTPTQPILYTTVWPVGSGLIQTQPLKNQTNAFSLLAVPEPNWQFDHWNGPISAELANPTIIFLAEQSELCQAVFSQIDAEGETERIIDFAGLEWTVRHSDTLTTPGGNYFSDQPNDVWTDQQGLHLTISNRDQKWFCTEVVLHACLGWGTYTFKTHGRLDFLDPQMVLGIFTWDARAIFDYHREIDIEFSQWGNPDDANNAQYVIQPCAANPECPDRYRRFWVEQTDQQADMTHVLVWHQDKVEFSSYYTTSGETKRLAYQWTYTGDFIPVPGLENIRFNFWLVDGKAPLNGLGNEIVISDFHWEGI
ncbi:MAG: hypothetical protein WC508_02605 [Patescibacteria group bacterium]